VLHSGYVPAIDTATWRFAVTGLVERPLALGWDEVTALPAKDTRGDIHWVTAWSRFDNLLAEDEQRYGRPDPVRMRRGPRR